MQYAGGKEKIAARLTAELIKHRNGHTLYVEPFIGGGSTFYRMAPHFEHSIGADIVPDLILLWQALQRGWSPPDYIDREEYETLRYAEPSALRAVAAFGYSFGGKWWGGYAGGGQYHVANPKAGLLRKAAGMSRAEFISSDYARLPFPGHEALVYCDPPYAHTTEYGAAHRFDTGAFWRQCRKWASDGATVLVSEYEAPPDIPCIWETAKSVSLSADTNRRVAVERLFLVTATAVREVMSCP